MSHGEADVAELPASPGARLKRAREARGLTPQQAAEQLTLDISVVTALEANDFVALGAPVFAKGHLRRYAALLELPGDDLLGGYERSNAQPGQPTLIPRSRTTMIPVRSRPKWPWVLGGMLAFMVAAAFSSD
jgi:cytoskeleton protein RodZ